MATTNIYDMADTWNDGATTFAAIKMNVTDTASNAASLLMDLQVGGTSKFKVDKTGAITASVGTNQPYLRTQFSNYYLQYDSNGGWEVVLNGTPKLSLTDGVSLSSVGSLRWTGVSDSGATIDLYLTRKAAATLQLGATDAAAPVAQTLGVQSVVAGTTNTNGTDFTIKGSAGTGTGTGGSIIFQVANTGASGTSQNAFGTSLVLSENTLALRNSTNAQTFNIYNTYTDASNYERMSLLWDTNVGYVSFEASGTGSVNRAIRFGAHSTTGWFEYSNNNGLNATWSSSTNFSRTRWLNGIIHFDVGVFSSALSISGLSGYVLKFGDAVNVETNTTTGTKIGTATSQKIAFWNATPIAQPTTGITAATFTANTSGISDDTATFDGYTIGQVVAALRSAGLLA